MEAAKFKGKIKTANAELSSLKFSGVSGGENVGATGPTVGTWGSKIKFTVSDKKQLTFRNMKRSSSGRWATHNIVGQRPKTEFLGPAMDEITMDVILSANMGVNPRRVMKEFRFACKKGEVHYLRINSKKVCRNKMAISSVSESWDEIWNKGELMKAVITVTFSEYR